MNTEFHDSESPPGRECRPVQSVVRAGSCRPCNSLKWNFVLCTPDCTASVRLAASALVRVKGLGSGLPMWVACPSAKQASLRAVLKVTPVAVQKDRVASASHPYVSGCKRETSVKVELMSGSPFAPGPAGGPPRRPLRRALQS